MNTQTTARFSHLLRDPTWKQSGLILQEVDEQVSK